MSSRLLDGKAPSTGGGALWTRPATQSLMLAVVFYALFYGILRPGYAILDDLKIISILAGYPGVQPAPFLIFSNVLLGLVLIPLYGLHTGLNWEIVLFSIFNFLSVWTLLYLLMSGAVAREQKVFAGSLLLACASYYALNLTFSGTAALACTAGLCAIGTNAMKGRARNVLLGTAGIGLVFAGSLVRIQMLYLTLPLVCVALLWVYRRLRLGALVGLAVLAGVLVAAGFAFDRLYVRSYPDWNSYYFYNFTAQAVQDSHRLENMHLEIRRVGWSANDQELFARSFFPDAGTYSVGHLRYLVDRVAGMGNDPVYAATSVLSRLATVAAAPFLLACLAAWLWEMAFQSGQWWKNGIPVVVAVAIAEAMGLSWVYKDPEYVLLASLSNTALIGVVLLGANSDNRSTTPATQPRAVPKILVAGGIIAAAAAIAVSASQALTTSNANVQRQTAYAAILSDLARLQEEQKLPKDAVIISPAYGIPIDWANPFVVDFPQISYLDTGWSTFSPPYEQALRNFGITSLPDALYQKPNVYLMSETIFKDFLARYFQEHEGVTVSFETVYTLGYPDRYAGYHEVELYKVLRGP